MICTKGSITVVVLQDQSVRWGLSSHNMPALMMIALIMPMHGGEDDDDDDDVDGEDEGDSVNSLKAGWW